jgi:hypothetical protein
MRGRTCPCNRARLVNEQILPDEFMLRTRVSLQRGVRFALLDIVYDSQQGCLLLQATREMLTIRVVSAGTISTLRNTPGLAEQEIFASFWVRTTDDKTECVREFDRFSIEADTATGSVIVAASGLTVVVFPLHSPVLLDCRAPNTGTQTRRWLRLPWNDSVERQNDAWMPRRISRAIGSGLDYLFDMLFG